MATGMLYLNDRDVETDFSLKVTDWPGLPGQLGGAPRDVVLLDGPEMSGAIIDPRQLRRTQATVTIGGRIETASTTLALAALDALRNTLVGGEVAIRTAYATDRHCLGVCTLFEGSPHQPDVLNGNVTVRMTFVIRDGVAVRIAPDGYALSTTRVACPIGTAESRPVILVHGGGVAMTNPTVTLRNAAGDVVQTMAFTVSLGTTAALRIDCARMTASVITAGTITDALALGYWTSGDFPVLRPSDGWVESAAYPSVELSSNTGTPVGEITYTRRYS